MNTLRRSSQLLPICTLFGITSMTGQSNIPRVNPSSLVEVEVWCENFSTRQIVPNCNLTAAILGRTRSNGHFHTGGGQPVSKLATTNNGPFSSSVSVNTGSTGVTTVWLQTHEVGLYEDIRVCSLLGCTSETYLVGFDDLVRVPPNNLWFHVGGNRTNHGSNYYNHWMVPFARDKLENTIRDFNAVNPGHGKIAVNDMGLPRGGTFDVKQNWRPPHYRHSRGTAVDIRGNGGNGSVPTDFLDAFVEICNLRGALYAEAEGKGVDRHIHCDW